MRTTSLQHALKVATLLLVVATALSCSSRPSKYRKKRGCDCPKWNHRYVPAANGVHAALPGQPTAPFGQQSPYGPPC